ncbi:kinase-like domain-containing protein [Zopfochytrium polystomum]|nr:kinase-like domain-containing protein [Zopfochytrium polystomum]
MATVVVGLVVGVIKTQGLDQAMRTLLKFATLPQLKKLNDKGFAKLTDRAKSIYDVLKDAVSFEKIFQNALQPVQEVVRRFKAAVDSAILLIQQFESAKSWTKLCKADKFNERIEFINVELNACSADVAAICSMKAVQNQDRDRETMKKKIDEIKKQEKAFAQSRNELVKATQDTANRFNQAVIQNRRANEEAIVNMRDLLRDQIAGIKAAVGEASASQSDVFAKNVDGLKQHLDDKFDEIHDQIEKLNASIERIHGEHIRISNENVQAYRIANLDQTHVTDLKLIDTTVNHEIYAAEYRSSPASLVRRVIFKAIKPEVGKPISVEKYNIAREELHVLYRLQDCSYIAKPVGFLRLNTSKAGVVMEAANWKPSLSDAKGFVVDESWKTSVRATVRQMFVPEPSAMADARLYREDDLCTMPLRFYLTAHIVEWSTRIRFMGEVTEALAYIHDKRIVHGDLTAWDVLVTHDSDNFEHITVVDFDRSYIFHETKPRVNLEIEDRKWCHAYTAPEMLKGPSFGFASFATDVFAAGTILWELAFCAIPYGHIPLDQVADRIYTGYREPIPVRTARIVEGIPRQLAHIIEQAWRADPTERPVARQLRDAVVDLFVPNVSTTHRVRQEALVGTIDTVREAYLRARQGVGAEELISVRVVAEMLLSSSIPDKDWPLEHRRGEAVRLLQVAVETMGDGGAAHFLATSVYESQPEVARTWLSRAAALGHPTSVLQEAIAAHRLGKMTKGRLETIARETEELQNLKLQRTNERKLQRSGLLSAVLQGN